MIHLNDFPSRYIPDKLYSVFTCKLLITALLLQTFDWPCPRVQHSHPHHHRVNLGNLPGDIGLQLVKGGRALAVDLGLEEAPESEVEGGTRSIPYSRKVIPNSTDNLIVFKSI